MYIFEEGGQRLSTPGQPAGQRTRLVPAISQCGYYSGQQRATDWVKQEIKSTVRCGGHNRAAQAEFVGSEEAPSSLQVTVPGSRVESEMLRCVFVHVFIQLRSSTSLMAVLEIHRRAQCS